jgi:hypothetical protein
MEQKYKPYIMYKIICNDDENLIYIGSTTNFRCRKNKHKNSCHNETVRDYNVDLYKNIRENGGWCNFTMKPIEMYYSDCKIKARIRENELMSVFNSNLNSSKAFRSEEEKKEYKKEYYNNHKEEFKLYRECHKEKSKEYNQNYFNNNKVKLLEQNKEYYETNKDKINSKRNNTFVICDCGIELRKDKLKRHLTSKKHQQFILNSL